MTSLPELIAAAPIFAGLPAEHLELVTGCGRIERADAGALLLREGDAADRFFLIRAGTVRLEVHAPSGGALAIETLGPQEVVGWSWLFSPYRCQLDARALEPASLVAFDAACLRAKCESDHELGYELMRRFADVLIHRLQATRLQLLDVYGHAVVAG